MRMPASALTLKQQRFADEYLVDLNAKQAAIRAGYSPRSAEVTGAKLLSNTKVAAYVKSAASAQQERTRITADVVLGELLRLARVDLSEAYDESGKLRPVREMPEDLRRAIAGVESDEIWEWVEDDDGERRRELVGFTRKVKFWDKTRALELLGKHLKLFTDRVDVTSNGQTIANVIAQAFASAAVTVPAPAEPGPIAVK